jgi:type I restriction enzyme S subunit
MSLPRYESYKDSGVEWLGEVPEHWGIVRLRYLCKIETGDADTADSNEDGAYPFFVRSPNIEKINRYTHDCEAILTAGDGVGVGKVFHYFDGKFCAHQRVYIFRQFEGVQGKFFFHYLKELFLRVVLEGTAKSTVDSLRRPMIADFLMTVPYIEEQSKITKFLDQETAKIDNLIAEQQQLIKLLKEKRQAVISHAVTKGLNPDVPMKDSGIEWLGEVPEHWDNKRLKHIGDSFIGLIYDPNDVVDDNSGDGILVLRSSNVQDGLIVFDDNVFVNKVIPDRLKTRIGDILICSRNGSRALIGKNAIIDENSQNQTFGAFMTVFRCCMNDYVFWIFNSQLFKAQSGSFLTSTINQLTVGNLMNFEILIPTLYERQLIISFLQQETTTIDTLIAESTNLISLSKERRSALISAAVTGKIDVRNFVPSQPQVEAMA